MLTEKLTEQLPLIISLLKRGKLSKQRERYFTLGFQSFVLATSYISQMPEEMFE